MSTPHAKIVHYGRPSPYQKARILVDAATRAWNAMQLNFPVASKSVRDLESGLSAEDLGMDAGKLEERQASFGAISRMH